VDADKKDSILYKRIFTNYSKGSSYQTPVDTACLKQWLKQPDFSFTVKDKEIKVSHNYNHPCPWNSVPCSNYAGPLPQ
jgi:hypothetical protein